MRRIRSDDKRVRAGEAFTESAAIAV